MTSRCYTQVQGQYRPINAVASDTVRCLACNQFYPPTELSQHLRTHILPSHQKFQPRVTKAEKINLKRLIE